MSCNTIFLMLCQAQCCTMNKLAWGDTKFPYLRIRTQSFKITLIVYRYIHFFSFHFWRFYQTASLIVFPFEMLEKKKRFTTLIDNFNRHKKKDLLFTKCVLIIIDMFLHPFKVKSFHFHYKFKIKFFLPWILQNILNWNTFDNPGINIKFKSIIVIFIMKKKIEN